MPQLSWLGFEVRLLVVYMSMDNNHIGIEDMVDMNSKVPVVDRDKVVDNMVGNVYNYTIIFLII